MSSCLRGVLICIVACSYALSAQEPVVHLRADTLVAVTDSNRILSWKPLYGIGEYLPDSQFVSPLLVRDALNHRPAIRFANDGYLIGSAVFPVNSDYTLYIVAQWHGKSASNNIVSGNSRALFLANTPYPKVLHNADFNRMATSSVAMDGPTIIRVTYNNASKTASIALNNVVGCNDAVPGNTDSTMYIGSYARGNFFWGDIAEVLLYDQLLDSIQQYQTEATLHSRYGIPRAPDPLPSVIRWTRVARPFEFLAEEDAIEAKGTVTDPAVHFVHIAIDSVGIPVTDTTIDVRTTSSFAVSRSVSTGLHTYRLTAEATMADGSIRSEVDAHNIVCGTAIAVEGQSNSIYGDASLTASLYARTYGTNFGNSPSDTTFAPSIATGNGGGRNVGAWALQIQQQLARTMEMPSCIINGGVGGTKIQQHFPDTLCRLNLNTIYGSWLYRLEKSRLRERIRWLFWYQGESNNGEENYLDLFHRMYTAWKADLPNLRHIVVVQIRPGCGGTSHARLRDDQRRLQEVYSDVIVHSACGLPGHDGCHFTSAGYHDLAEQLFLLYQDVESGNINSAYRAPTVKHIYTSSIEHHVVVEFEYAKNLQILQSNGRPIRTSFYLNGNELLQPDSAWIVGSTVLLHIPDTIEVQTVSYIPSKTVAGSTEVYEGPWLADEVGVGAITFFDVPTTVSTIPEDAEIGEQYSPLIVHRGEAIACGDACNRVMLYNMSGGVVQVMAHHGSYTIPYSLPAGVYVSVSYTERGACSKQTLMLTQ